jgi:hypothetical protein
MDLSVDTSDDGDDEDDTQAQEVDFDDDEDDEDDDAADGDALRANWGKRKKTYYGQEDEEEAEFDSDEEAAINEEQEVKRLQKKRAEERSDADFDSLGELISQAKAKSSKVSASNDLRAFTMDIDVYESLLPQPRIHLPDALLSFVGALLRESPAMFLD